MFRLLGKTQNQHVVDNLFQVPKVQVPMNLIPEPETLELETKEGQDNAQAAAGGFLQA